MNNYEKESFLFYFVGVATISICILLVCFLLSITDAHAEMIDLNRIAQIESSNNPNAWNKAEDGRGLFQINPICLKEWNNFHPKEQYTKDQLFDAQINTRIAAWYLQVRIPSMIKHYGKPDTIENRLIAFNAGINYVKTGKPIPATTRDYIAKYKRG